MAAAKWLSPRKLRSSFSYRTNSFRKRLNQLCATSTTHRRAFFVGSRRFVADFLAAAFDVGNLAVGLDDARSWSAGIARVGAQMFATPQGCRRACEHEGIQHRLQLTDVMSVSSGHDQRQRDATTVYRQMSLVAIFSPIRRIGEDVAELPFVAMFSVVTHKKGRLLERPCAGSGQVVRVQTTCSCWSCSRPLP